MGPNGAGKTTTINILCTLSKPTSGRATIDGLNVVRQQSQVRQSIGLVFQDPSLDERLSGLQNLRFHALVYGLPASVREQRIEQMLRMMELWDKRHSEVRTYSGGMKRRLELARGLLHYPKVLFLDEPTLGLDPVGTREIRELILDLKNKQGLTIVMTSHILSEVQATCDRIGIINGGKLALEETMANLNNTMTGSEERLVEFKLTEITPGLVKDIDAVKGVTSVTQENGRLYVNSSVESDVTVSRTIVENGSTILVMKPREYTLEEIFMKYYEKEA